MNWQIWSMKRDGIENQEFFKRRHHGFPEVNDPGIEDFFYRILPTFTSDVVSCRNDP